MKEYVWNTQQEVESVGRCMSSLLVMATAIEDMPMESILIKGRVITVEELLAKCEKVENELRFVSRGLLEVTSPGPASEYGTWNGDQRLCDSNMRTVDFIHRSAVDFLMDEGPGLQYLQVCGLSQSEQVSRLLAAHLVRSRFISLSPGRNCHQQSSILRMLRLRVSYINPYLRMAILMVFDNSLDMDNPFRNGLLKIIKERQFSGLFGGHMHWAIPKCLHTTMDSLELELIETGVFLNCHYDSLCLYDIGTSSRDAIINAETFLNNYPAAQLLNAIQIVLRGLSSSDSAWSGIEYPSKILKYILRRLKCITSDEVQSPETTRDTIRGLHSWYIVHCLKWLVSTCSRPFPAESPDMELFYELSKTLLLEDEWHHGVLFEFHANRTISFAITGDPENSFCDDQYALVIGNFATAYRLLDKVMFSCFSRSLSIEIPQTSASQFEPILIADMYQDRAEYYIPDVKLYHRIEDMLCANLLQTMESEKEGRWYARLKSSGSELSPMDSSQVFKYVMDEVKKRDMNFTYTTCIMWLGDIYERGQSFDGRDRDGTKMLI